MKAFSMRLVMVPLLLLGAMASADARGGRQTNQQQTPQQSPAPTPPASVPEPWPRLDVGAVLCTSRDDLVKYQTQMANGASVATAGRASGCHTVREQTGIKILDSDGPSRTQIVTTDESKETGWTDAYLPSTPTSSVAKSAGVGE
jgi:hypothetical protein